MAPAPFKPKKDLHKLWSSAKKSSAKEAKATGKDAAKANAKVTKGMKSNLGPNLDKWVKAFGKRRDMEALQAKIEGALDTYEEIVLAAIGKGVKVDKAPDHLKTLAEAVDDVRTRFAKDVAAALEQLGGDAERATKDSEIFSDKNLKPLIVAQGDVVKELGVELKKRKIDAVEVSGSLEIEVIIGDTDLLRAFWSRKENAVIQVNVHEAAGFDSIIARAADAVAAIADDLVAGKVTEAAATKSVTKAVGVEVDAALRRAEDALEKELKIRGKHRANTAKAVGSIALKVTAIAGGLAGLAMTPFTGGASAVIGLVAIYRTCGALGKEIGEAMVGLDTMVGALEYDVTELAKSYKVSMDEAQQLETPGKNKLAFKDWGKETINTVLGSQWVATIPKLAADAGTCKKKTTAVHNKAQGLGAELPKLLDKQTELTRELDSWKKANAAEIKKLTAKDMKRVEALVGLVDEVIADTKKLIASVIDSQQRWSQAEVRIALLESNLAKIKSKTAKWLDFANATTSFLVEGGLIVGGNVAGALGPDAFKQFETAATIVTNVARVQDTATECVTIYNDASDIYGAKIERDKVKALRG